MTGSAPQRLAALSRGCLRAPGHRRPVLQLHLFRFGVSATRGSPRPPIPWDSAGLGSQALRTMCELIPRQAVLVPWRCLGIVFGALSGLGCLCPKSGHPGPSRSKQRSATPEMSHVILKLGTPFVPLYTVGGSCCEPRPPRPQMGKQCLPPHHVVRVSVPGVTAPAAGRAPGPRGSQDTRLVHHPVLSQCPCGFLKHLSQL